MSKSVWQAISSVLLTLSSLPVLADGAVKIDFQEPEKFTDVNERQFKTAPEKNQNLKQLKAWLEKRASKQLTAGQHLNITLQDIDLAGAFEPWHGPNLSDVRMIKDIYPPRVKLSFKLIAADGAVISEGERELRDLGYLLSTSRAGSDPLEHDKGLLESWLRKEFPTTK
jgi:hypothetical protein